MTKSTNQVHPNDSSKSHSSINKSQESREHENSRGQSISNEQFGFKNRRQYWNNEPEFFFTGVTFVIGLTNIWRLPDMCQRHGGKDFLIVYILGYILITIPITLMQLILGQFCSQGSMTCWGYASLFRGLGLAMVSLSAFRSLCDQILVPWSLFYLVASFFSPLPWSKCGELSNEYCIDNVVDKAKCDGKKFQAFPNGTCHSVKSGLLYGIYDVKLAEENKIKMEWPAQQYLEYSSLQGGHVEKNDFGELRWDITLCMAFSWILLMVVFLKGPKSLGKASYLIASVPIVLMTILFINGFFLKGSAKGFSYLIDPQSGPKNYSKMFHDVVNQATFSMGLVEGSLIVLSSYNRFNGDIIKYGFMFLSANMTFSILFLITSFLYAGHFAIVKNTTISAIWIDERLNMIYIIFPSAIDSIPYCNIWAVIFFITILFLSLICQIPRMENLLTAMEDTVPELKLYRKQIVLVVICFSTLLSIIMCTQGGVGLFRIIESAIFAWNSTIIVFLFNISISYVYGAKRFMKDLSLMIDNVTCYCIPMSSLKIFLYPCWYVITPLLLLIAIFNENVVLIREIRSHWLYVIAVFIMGMSYSLTFLPMLGMLLITKGTLKQRVNELITPQRFWGPHLIKDREKVDYVESFRKYPSEECISRSDVRGSTNSICNISRWSFISRV